MNLFQHEMYNHAFSTASAFPVTWNTYQQVCLHGIRIHYHVTMANSPIAQDVPYHVCS